MTNEIFIVSEGKEAANNWLICYFGSDNNNNTWHVTSNNLHGDEFYGVYSHGAKEDAELVAKLLNEYYSNPFEKLMSDDEWRSLSAQSRHKLNVAFGELHESH